MKKYLIILVLALFAVVIALGYMLQSSRQQQRVLINNNKSLSQPLKTSKAKDGREVAKTIVRQSTKANLGDSQINTVKNMELKPSAVNSVGTIETKLDTTVKGTTKRTATDTCYYFEINAQTKAVVCVKNDTPTYHPTISNKQDIVFADERVFVNKRKRFFIARWLQKRQTVVTASVVNSNQAIKVVNQSFTHIIK